MSWAKGLFSFFWSLVQLFARRQVKGNKHSEAAAVVVVTGAPSTVRVANAGFDMKAEIARLAERIMEPVSGKIASQDLQPVSDGIRNTFEQFIAKPATFDTDFKAMALAILAPLQSLLSEGDFSRVVDRLRGAMAGFCQGDVAKAKSKAEAPPAD